MIRVPLRPENKRPSNSDIFCPSDAVAVSHSLQKILQVTFGSGPEPWTIINQSIDSSHCNPRKEEIPLLYEKSAKNILFGSVSHVEVLGTDNP